MLSVEGLSFAYNKSDKKIFENLSFAIESTQIVGIAAPSGFGKTTLCKILAGYEVPQQGRILLNGEDVCERKKKAYNPIQLIWQHPELSVNPRLPLQYVFDESPLQSNRDEIVDGLCIQKEWYTRLPKELSAGEIQRFCIARTLSEQTQFILADEITAMFDAISQSQIWHFLINYTQKHKIGMIAVSHSQSLLEKISTRIINLQAS
ncbi:MAG: ATP-binding cassette domain-containing protein [Treponemataceae bacterium]